MWRFLLSTKSAADRRHSERVLWARIGGTWAPTVSNTPEWHTLSARGVRIERSRLCAITASAPRTRRNWGVAIDRKFRRELNCVRPDIVSVIHMASLFYRELDNAISAYQERRNAQYDGEMTLRRSITPSLVDRFASPSRCLR